MLEQVNKIEIRRKALNVKMATILRDAGVDGSTWHRWKNGGGGKVHTLQKIEAVLTRMESKDKKK